MLLEETEEWRRRYHDGDDDRVLEIADRAGQHGRTDQHDDEEIPELVQELAPRRARRLLGEAVGAALGQPHRGLRIGEALCRITAELADTGAVASECQGRPVEGGEYGGFIEQASGG